MCVMPYRNYRMIFTLDLVIGYTDNCCKSELIPVPVHCLLVTFDDKRVDFDIVNSPFLVGDVQRRPSHVECIFLNLI